MEAFVQTKLIIIIMPLHVLQCNYLRANCVALSLLFSAVCVINKNCRALFTSLNDDYASLLIVVVE